MKKSASEEQISLNGDVFSVAPEVSRPLSRRAFLVKGEP